MEDEGTCCERVEGAPTGRLMVVELLFALSRPMMIDPCGARCRMDSSDSWLRLAIEVLGTALLFTGGKGVTGLAGAASRTEGTDGVLRSAKLRDGKPFGLSGRDVSERVTGGRVVAGVSERLARLTADVTLAGGATCEGMTRGTLPAPAATRELPTLSFRLPLKATRSWRGGFAAGAVSTGAWGRVTTSEEPLPSIRSARRPGLPCAGRASTRRAVGICALVMLAMRSRPMPWLITVPLFTT